MIHLFSIVFLSMVCALWFLMDRKCEKGRRKTSPKEGESSACGLSCWCFRKEGGDSEKDPGSIPKT